jgi:hypothetical protein
VHTSNQEPSSCAGNVTIRHFKAQIKHTFCKKTTYQEKVSAVWELAVVTKNVSDPSLSILRVAAKMRGVEPSVYI